MLSVLSKLKRDKNQQNGPSAAPAPMSSALQKKFSKGVHYNSNNNNQRYFSYGYGIPYKPQFFSRQILKILIKGDRNVGKSCLLQRLQGGPFIDEYRPTDQIQIAPIHWTYKNTDHIVKVEVWEVVDKGRAKKKAVAGLKLDNSPGSEAQDETPALDATFLDVYKNANGVIMMMDITKPWTFEYVVRELSGVPPEIPVIVLGNHCDMHHHRQVHPHQIEQVITDAKETRSGDIRYAEASMRNGFGLRLLHRFFNVPFLLLQRATLMTQVALNQQETDAACQELEHYQNSEEADYSAFLDKLANKRRQESVPPPIHDIKTPSIVLGAGKPIIPPSSVNPLANTNIQVSPNKPFLEKLNIVKTNLSPAPIPVAPQIQPQPSSEPSKPVDDLEDFCAGDLDNSFLDEPSQSSNSRPQALPKRASLNSESDDEHGNPLVLGIQDDLDSADEASIPTFTTQSIKETSKFYSKPEKTSSSLPPPSVRKENVEVNMLMYGISVPEEDSEPELNSQTSPDYEPPPMWASDTCIRRSPEGGEDVSGDNNEIVEKKEKKHKKSKKSSKDKEKSSSSSSGDKEKKKKKDKDKKHKRKTSDEYLEEFLNGTPSVPDGAQEAYEDI